ncbi:hypothetical protein EYC84_011125 [Monilinia fructicola]|uniref:Serine hydrolase domain-containing protein n=1 Tax=Monilinia fructicola TaxID=38448 RepID=A0A5M9J4L4_MONFR|nr:hypothetical protein EYC84_011125 [Monilinia fructicola]
MQTVAIRYELEDYHTYDFIEGAVPWPMAPGLEVLVPTDMQTFDWADKESAESCARALKDLDAYVSENGPFDGVLAFSSGAALAATLIIHKQQQNPKQERLSPTFKFAVFFSGGTPGDPAALLQRGEIRYLQSNSRHTIHIPTAHIWGANDNLYPSFGPILRDLCDSELREEFVHEGAHEIPGSADKKGVASATRIIKRTIERALSRQ